MIKNLQKLEHNCNDDDDDNDDNFSDMGLDHRLLKSIAKLGWEKPTVVQQKMIRLVLSGQDLLVRARTGSGKTAAYLIPLIHKLLKQKQNEVLQATKAVIIAPSKELCYQIATNIKELSSFCSREIRVADVSPQLPLSTQKPLLKELPDIVVGTGSRLLNHVVANNLDHAHLQFICLDEADLLTSYGHHQDIITLAKHISGTYQALLISATLNEDVLQLKQLLNNPVTLKLEESCLPNIDQLTQYKLDLEENEKYLSIYALLKLNILQGKTIIFVNSVDKSYKLKLYLEQFAINSCVLNSELPATSRCHVISQFNEGRYDIIIAADQPYHAQNKNNKYKGWKKDVESGVSRGIDFKDVTTVVNFDFPPDVNSYIHRVGRTARIDRQGVCVSFVSLKEIILLRKVEEELKSTHPNGIGYMKFEMSEVEKLAYRAETARRTITKDAIREARKKEIKAEILNSEKLKAYFEDNPRDLQVLRHDKPLHSAKLQPQLAHIPQYLVPESLQNISSHTTWKRNSKKKEHRRNTTKGQIRHRKRQADPLKSFTLQPKAKKKKVPTATLR